MKLLSSRLDRSPEAQLPWWHMEKDKRRLRRSARQYVRRTNGLVIVFWSKDTIYVTGDGQKLIINRWFDTKKNYEHWNLMCDSLKKRNTLTMTDVRQLAQKHGFQMCGCPSLPKGIEEIMELEEHYKWHD